ncbi:alpha/beta hydrolase [Actinoplanes sp. NEAU-A12]|uniref:Alpha/beta hydrolase n=1 Tax=Actinoplanes sandaracinus TaxID=3045177 RepID=A0ABT6X2F4_9ACTN|nr:alpha/beta hydrolase [Actinoplanes sandaracinus]MDI6106010.1 alpha/beta hydrolase [Actinoplanes sandaracinus]
MFDLTVPDLRDARLDALDAAGEAWLALARHAENLSSDAVTEVSRPLHASGWDGAAAQSAFGSIDKLEDKFELTAMRCRTMGTMLTGAADSLRGLQLQLRALLDSAATQDCAVSDDGRVSPPPLSHAEIHDPDRAELTAQRTAAAAGLAQQIKDVLARASDIDADCAAALAKMDVISGTRPYEFGATSEDARAAAGALGLAEAGIPAPGDSRVAHAWWEALTPQQRHLYATAWPEKVGALDGLPAVDRDYANQLGLRNLIGDDINRGHGEDTIRHQRALMLLEKLESAEHGPQDKRMYLLSVDLDQDGKAVVAVGNPDTADRTGILVPGVGTEVDGIRGLVGRASDIQSQAMKLAPGTSVAMIGWLGYDTPDADSVDVVTAPFGDKSQAGATALDSFVNGLHASHEGGGAHITAIGHSYGSTVLGEAAKAGDGLNVVDMVAVGSPGMRVEHAGEFNVPAQHVWAGAAVDDNFVARPENSTLGDFFFGDDIAEIHGPGPHYPQFGGNVLSIDTSGHSGYWDDNSQSLRSQAAIVLGDGYYEHATLESGKAPS